MMERFEEVAKDDVVMAWFLNTAEKIAADQRDKSIQYSRNFNPYSGPNPPDGLRLFKLPEGEKADSFATK